VASWARKIWLTTIATEAETPRKAKNMIVSACLLGFGDFCEFLFGGHDDVTKPNPIAKT
jgi:hypothetical protein